MTAELSARLRRIFDALPPSTDPRAAMTGLRAAASKYGYGDIPLEPANIPLR